MNLKKHANNRKSGALTSHKIKQCMFRGLRLKKIDDKIFPANEIQKKGRFSSGGFGILEGKMEKKIFLLRLNEKQTMSYV